MRRNRLVLERIFIGRWWFKQEGFLQHRFTIQFVSVCFFYDSISFRSILGEAPRKPNIHSFVLVLVLFSFFFHSRVYVYIQIIESSTLRRQKKKTHTHSKVDVKKPNKKEENAMHTQWIFPFDFRPSVASLHEINPHTHHRALCREKEAPCASFYVSVHSRIHRLIHIYCVDRKRDISRLDLYQKR